MFLFTSRDSNVENRLAITKTIMVRVAEINKYTKIAPDFGLPSRRANRSIFLTFGATPRAGQKTSPPGRIDLFDSEALPGTIRISDPFKPH
jgi:hypothetical protein